MRALILGTALFSFAASSTAEVAQDQGRYRQALSDHSTSPYFVLVTIKDDRTGTAFTGCINVNFLKGAIFRELGGESEPPASAEKRQAQNALLQKAEEIALKSTDHEFHFSNPAALANVQLQYTEADLAEAREAVRSHGLEVMAGSAPERAFLGKLKRSAALACAIIEQGQSARRADITAEVYAVP
jgi:hypothetical protein